MEEVDPGLARCVRRNDGLILRSEQKHLPDASNVLRTLLNRGVLTRLRRGAYVETRAWAQLKPWERFDLEAKALGESACRILAGYSAAAVWGLWRYQSTPPRHEVYGFGGGTRLKSDPQVRQVHYNLSRKDITGQHLKATAIDRTIVDLTRLHGFGAGFVAACSALRQDLTTLERLRAYDISGMEGLAHWPLVLEHATGVVESALEAVFLAQVVFFGDFQVIPQVVVRGKNGKNYHVDFRVDGSDELIEVDGRGKYGASESEQEFNLAREKERADNLPRQPHRFGHKDVMSLQAYRRMAQVLGLWRRWDLPLIHHE